MPASTTRFSAVQMTARSASPASLVSCRLRTRRPPSPPDVANQRHFAIAAPPARVYGNHQFPITSRHVPHGFVHGLFPYAGPCPRARPAMAGGRKPSPCRSLSRNSSFLGSGIDARDVPPAPPATQAITPLLACHFDVGTTSLAPAPSHDPIRPTGGDRSGDPSLPSRR
jgi:hypothetical protein